MEILSLVRILLTKERNDEVKPFRNLVACRFLSPLDQQYPLDGVPSGETDRVRQYRREPARFA